MWVLPPYLPDSELIRYATPLKVVEYMAAGLPVITTCVGQGEIMLRQSQAGILIDHSVKEFSEAAILLLTDKKLYQNYSQAAITYSRNFDWDILMDQMYQYVLHIMAQGIVKS